MALAATLFALIALPAGPGSPPDRSIARNATAEVIVEKTLALGIEFGPSGGGKAPRPAAEDLQALQRAGSGSWLEAQVKVPDDTVAEPPSDLRSYLDDSSRRDALEAIVSALEKEPPVWDEPEKVEQPRPELLPSLRLQRILLAACLVAVKDGRTADAERILEASWSLGRPLAEAPLVASQTFASGVARLQAGVLRKLQTAPPAWIDRFSSDTAWPAMLDAMDAELSVGGKGIRKSLESAAPAWKELFEKAPPAMVDGLKHGGPCEAVSEGEDGLWKLVERDLSIASNEQTEAIRKNYRDLYIPSVANGVRRAAQVAVDRELTLRILRLRLAKEQDRNGRWPESLADPVSSICPALGYAYRADRNGMEIRFEGAPIDPGSPLLLPLEYRSVYRDEPAPMPTATPATAPALTPTPEGGMIPPP